MTMLNGASPHLGAYLASRLGLRLPRREGHDLAGPCIACDSSDAFRLHEEVGIAQCYSCGGKWSPFQVAEIVLGDRQAACSVMVELGAYAPRNGGSAESNEKHDPVVVIARSKGISPEVLRAFGAEAVSPMSVRLPAYGPDGTACTTFTMSTGGGKGLFEKGKPAGLFFPHDAGVVRLPRAGDVWHLVEGPKDAAALHGLGLLACGMNTCRLAAKFARLFVGADIILVPDRDRAGEEGAEHSAGVLRGVARSIRIAVLPAEFKESDGSDVRDVLRGPNGRDLVLQAITDSQPAWKSTTGDDHLAPIVATTDVELPEGEPLRLILHPPQGRPQRLAVIRRGGFEFRDRVDTNSSTSRERLLKKLAEKLGIERGVLSALVEPHLIRLSDQCGQCAGSGADDDEEQSQATLAANMAAEWTLWHTPAKDAFVSIPIDSHVENWPVKSQTFKRFLAKQFFDSHSKAMNSDALSSAINLLEAKALFEGDEHSVHVRVAEHDGNIYVDLCDGSWRVAEITRAGWSIRDESPVMFRRSRGMLPLPPPESGGSVEELRSFLNVDDATWPLVVSWLVSILRPRGPYPVLALFAEQGSGKSTTGRLLRNLVDPNSAPLRAEPKDGRDLMIAANNSWCLAYDNLSHVPSWLSDAMCRLSTGGGFATRELFTDQDEIIFDSQRPLMLTSIEEVATRSDLLDRCLIVWLPAIPEDRRRPEAEMLAQFEAARPRIFGALLDAVSGALRDLPAVRLACLPRMADFAVWAVAAESGLGWAPGRFLMAYHGNRESANELAIDSTVIGRPLLEHLESNGGWTGTSSELLHILESRASDQAKRQTGWPKNPRALSGQLKRLSPNLRASGWSADFGRNAKRREWTFQRTSTPAPIGDVHDAIDASPR